MRCSAERTVCLTHLRRKPHLATGRDIKLLLGLVEHGVIVAYAIDNVELAHRGAALRIVGIALTGGSHRTTLVVNLRTAELCRHGVCLRSLP